MAKKITKLSDLKKEDEVSQLSDGDSEQLTAIEMRCSKAKSGDKMLFFFDYGDCWHFIVELRDVRKATVGILFPVLLRSVGEAPLQYPPIDEDNISPVS